MTVAEQAAAAARPSTTDPSSADPSTPDPIAALAGAVADANDRLLGLLELTRQSADSLDEVAMVSAFLVRAMSMLSLDAVLVSGAIDLAIGDVQHCRRTSAHQLTLRRPIGATSNASHETQELTLDFWRTEERFDTPDNKLLDGVANLTANAVAVARLHRAELEMAVIAGEHTAAAELTHSVLPDSTQPPDIDEVSCFARLIPARNTGGDFYFWQADSGHLWFAIGDVSGKGLPAAVLMTTMMSSLRSALDRHHAAGPAAVLRAVERDTHTNLSDSGRFVTLSIGRFEPATSRLDIVNAGHSPIVLRSGDSCHRIQATKPPIGVVEEIEATTESLLLENASLLVLATDGFTEQESTEGRPFGEDEFDALIATLDPATGADVAGATLFDAIVFHTGEAEQSDDRTLMVLGFS